MLKKGIVILTYNDVEWTKNLLNMIIPYHVFDEIVVVDNCSTCIEINELQSYNNEYCSIIRSEKNGGYSYGNNYGAKYLLSKTKLDILFFANPDVSFDIELIRKIESKFEKTDYSVLSGVMIDAEGNIDHTTYWNHPVYFEELMSCFYLYRRFHMHSMNKKIDFDKEVMDVDVLTGAFFGIRADTFVDIDMFDENVFLFSEENILAKKLSAKMMKEGLITGVFYTHYESKIVNQNIKYVGKYKQQLKSRLYYFNKYCNCHGIKYLLLKVCMSISILEVNIIEWLRNKMRNSI